MRGLKARPIESPLWYGISKISKPSVILKLYAETRKRTFTYLVKSLIFHLLCTFKFKGKNIAETLPFIENISKKIKEMLFLAPILVQTYQQICLLYPRKFDTDRYLLVMSSSRAERFSAWLGSWTFPFTSKSKISQKQAAVLISFLNND